MRDALVVWIKRNNWTPLLVNGMDGVKAIDEDKDKNKSTENVRN